MSLNESEFNSRKRDLFLKALEQENPRERAAFLDGACLGEPELRSAIEALLCSHHEDSFLERPVMRVDLSEIAPLPAVGIAATHSPSPMEQPGDVIGRYKLLQKLGEGGCGAVYMAQQEEPVRRKVALKVIKLGMDTREVIARFEAERQALALMDHPNIARVYDGGATATGRPYFVMELVPGIRLTDYCDQNQLSTRERLDLFIKVCHAVQHAHQKGIIHRDLKPSNILVTLHDGVPVPKVIDFGIAKATDQKLTDKTLFTELGALLGTPAYMSPEQAELSGLDIDTRTDVYSLGVLLYQLLTGQPPFDPKELLAVGLDEMRRTIREKEPLRPSTRLTILAKADLKTLAQRRATDAPKLANLVKGDLDWIVMKCLEKDRVRRYETANGLALDIQRHLANEPVTARPPGALYRIQKLVRRNRLVVAATSAVAAAIVIGFGISVWQSIEKARAYERARTEAKTSREVARFLKQMLAGVGPAVALGRDTTMLREILDKTADRLGSELNGQPKVEGTLRNTLGEVYRALGQDEKAAAMHRRALEIARREFGDESEQTGESLNNLALALEGLGLSAEAETHLRQSLDLHRKLLGPEHDRVAGVLNNLAIALKNQGKLPEAEARQREGLKLIQKLRGERDEHVGLSQQNLASLVMARGRLPEAEALARSALGLFLDILGREHPRVANALAVLAAIQRESGQMDEAETTFREVVDLRRRLLGENHPDAARSRLDLAKLLLGRNKLDEADDLSREALESLRRIFGPENRAVAFALTQRAEILEAKGRLREAADLQSEALAIRRTLLGSVHPDVVRSLNGLADVLAKAGDSQRAESLLKEALTTTDTLLDDEHPNLVAPLKSLARFMEGQARLTEAEPLYLRALAIQTKAHGEDNAEVAKLSEAIARILTGLSRYREAEPFYRKVLTLRQAHLPPDHFDIFNVRIALARMLTEWAWTERSTIRPGEEPTASLVRAREAESLLRAGLTLSERQSKSNRGLVGDVRSRLGGAIIAVVALDLDLGASAREERLAEAQSLLFSARDMMQERSSTPAKYQRDLHERMVRLYATWAQLSPQAGHEKKAAEWKAKLVEFDLKSPPQSASENPAGTPRNQSPQLQ